MIRKVKPRLSFQKTFQNNTIELDGQAAVVSAMISELECYAVSVTAGFRIMPPLLCARNQEVVANEMDAWVLLFFSLYGSGLDSLSNCH